MNEINNIIDYYSNKIKEFGPTSKGVDWNSIESQNLRFEILSKVFENDNSFSLIDYGCGYGAYTEYAKKLDKSINYYGFDLSEEMIGFAKKKYQDSFFSIEKPTEKFDYVISSGIFNVKLNFNEKKWEEYIFNTLDELNNLSEKGFSFNMLTSYSDKELMKENLYYAEPEKFFKHCKEKYSKWVDLDHSYRLYEFSIIVKK